MDKNTLSNYGWIVIAVLVFSVMIALATPFGSYIEQGIRATTEGLFSTSENAMNSAFGDLGVEVEKPIFEEGYNGVKEIQLDTLKIDGEEYTFEVGMTWDEWVNSKYNTNGYYIYLDYVRTGFGEEQYNVRYKTLFGESTDKIGFYNVPNPNDEIVKDEHYWLDSIYNIGMDDEFRIGDKYFKYSDNNGKIVYNQIRYTYGID